MAAFAGLSTVVAAGTSAATDSPVTSAAADAAVFADEVLERGALGAAASTVGAAAFAAGFARSLSLIFSSILLTLTAGAFFGAAVGTVAVMEDADFAGATFATEDSDALPEGGRAAGFAGFAAAAFTEPTDGDAVALAATALTEAVPADPVLPDTALPGAVFVDAGSAGEDFREAPASTLPASVFSALAFPGPGTFFAAAFFAAASLAEASPAFAPAFAFPEVAVLATVEVFIPTLSPFGNPSCEANLHRKKLNRSLYHSLCRNNNSC